MMEDMDKNKVLLSKKDFKLYRISHSFWDPRKSNRLTTTKPFRSQWQPKPRKTASLQHLWKQNVEKGYDHKNFAPYGKELFI